MNFRSDIQVLRAFSVLVVVIFHVSPGLLSGGFLGVDIFFVISGYLIIPKILDGLRKSNFSFGRFFRHRVIRLMPAYAMFLMLSVPLSLVFLPASELYNSLVSALSSIFYISNYYFYYQADYFDDALKFSPYLHTWSLSVEEQFYIIAPILLSLIFFFNFRLKYSLFLLFSASFLLFLFTDKFDPSFGFYSIFTRVWQFLIGAFFALYLPRIMKTSNSATISLLALFFMFLGVVGYDESFPTVIFTLVVTISAAFALAYPLSGRLGGFVYNFPLIKVGNWSYSIYLYHWILIVAFRSYVGNPEGIYDEVCLLTLSVVSGAVSYYLVERRSMAYFNLVPGSTILIYVVLTILILSAFTGILAVKYRGISPAYFVDIKEERRLYREGVCFLNSRYSELSLFSELCKIKDSELNVVLVGDSHAAHWYTSIKETIPDEIHVAQYNSSGCRPLLVSDGGDMCHTLIANFYSDMNKMKQGSMVILSARWKARELAQLRDTLVFIRSRGYIPVLFGPIIEYEQGLPRLLELSKNPMDYSNYEDALFLDAELSSIAADSGAIYISILKAICTSERNCITSVQTSKGSVPIQIDYGHLSSVGAREVLKNTAFKTIVLNAL